MDDLSREIKMLVWGSDGPISKDDLAHLLLILADRIESLEREVAAMRKEKQG